MGQNIFQIWDSIGRKTPFAVRRDNWSSEYYTIVERIECLSFPYGKAFGYPTINGQYSDHYLYDEKWKKEKLIPSCGSYQWSLVESFDTLNDTFEEPTLNSGGSNVYTGSSKFDFGKHKGLSLEIVFKRNPSYIEWAINNIETFCVTNETISYLTTLTTDFKFADITLKVNQDKLAELSSK